MFYDEYLRLCSQIDKSPTAVAKEIGLSGAHVTKWKKGSVPTDATKLKVCKYFNLPDDYFNEQKETATIDVVDDDLREYLDELRTRPEMRMLFSTTKTATKEQIEAIVKFIEGMRQ